MSRQAMTDRVLEARRADVIDDIRATFPVAGQKVTVREAGNRLYSRARRAFGDWPAALAAADRQMADPGRGFGGGPTELFKNMDAISANPLPGLPRHMRERQILGGMILERFAKQAALNDDPGIVATFGHGKTYADHELGEAFAWALRRYNITHMAPDHGALTDALRDSDGLVVAEKRYDQGDDTGGDVELHNYDPVEHDV